jgi:hypothetical protein
MARKTYLQLIERIEVRSGVLAVFWDLECDEQVPVTLRAFEGQPGDLFEVSKRVDVQHLQRENGLATEAAETWLNLATLRRITVAALPHELEPPVPVSARSGIAARQGA